jgi:hypothetical protein
MDWTTGVGFPAGTGTFSLRHWLQIGSGAHRSSYPMGVERPECEANHSHLALGLRMRRAIPPFPHSSSWRGAHDECLECNWIEGQTYGMELPHIEINAPIFLSLYCFKMRHWLWNISLGRNWYYWVQTDTPMPSMMYTFIRRVSLGQPPKAFIRQITVNWQPQCVKRLLTVSICCES